MKHMETSNGLRHASVAAILIGSVMMLHGTTTEAKPSGAPPILFEGYPSESVGFYLADRGYNLYLLAEVRGYVGEGQGQVLAVDIQRGRDHALMRYMDYVQWAR